MLDKVKSLKLPKFKLSNMYLPAVIIIFAVIFLVNQFGSKKDAGSSAGDENFQSIHYVDGIAFSVAQNFMSKATAISALSEGMDISRDSYYMYKNDGTQYMLFCVNEIVIAAQKGTRFNFAQAEDKIAALGNSSVMNIWFEKSYKKAKVDEISETLSVVPVNAGVVFTNEVYSDYCGELAVYNDGSEEWSLFVGVPGNRFDKLEGDVQDFVESMAKSIEPSEVVAEKEETYAVSLTNDSTEQEVVETIAPEVVETEPEITEIEYEDDEDTPEVETSEATPTPSESSDDAVSEDGVVTIGNEVESFEDEIKKNTTFIKKSSLNLNNQNTIAQKDDGRAYSSNIYSLLHLGDSGIITEMDVDSNEYMQPIIKIEELYTGQEAVDIIKNYCNSGMARYEYFNPPETSTWHVIKYRLNYSKCAAMPYINIKIKGMDGDVLKYRGVQYTPRTRDIAYKTQKVGDWYTDILCYYEVPNGCKEYVLECGSGTIENRDTTQLRAAYYYIKVPEESKKDVYNILDKDKSLKELKEKAIAPET